jgi:hypothetical protein
LCDFTGPEEINDNFGKMMHVGMRVGGFAQVITERGKLCI